MNAEWEFDFDPNNPVDREFVDTYIAACEHSVHSGLECPGCAARIFGVAGLGESAICVACRSIVVLDAEPAGSEIEVCDPETGLPLIKLRLRMFLRRPTDEEETLFLEMPSIQRAIEMVAKFHERYGVPPSS